MRQIWNAIDSFLFQPAGVTKCGPHIRDAICLKRWMMLVVFSLLPCVLVAIWNTGVQSLGLMNLYSEGFFHFVSLYWAPVLKEGLKAFLPLVLISYVVGGFWEGLFAVVRKHEIAEGFLVTGLLYPLILPPTIPYWMAALGISVGIILSKELFGGTGMNILNPALTCRCFLYFSFPTAMTGDVWADGYTQPTALAVYHMGGDGVKRIHIDTILNNPSMPLPELQQLLHLSPDNMQDALKFVDLQQGIGLWSNWNLFLGNKLGSFGEVSILACLLGAFFLLYFKLASWRTMAAVVVGAFATALAFEYGSGDFSEACFGLPAYKHFLMGGLVFGLVFMATDPVSGPAMNSAKWIYGLLIGMLTIVIRAINPAYPEGIMLAILFGNVFAPLLDHYAVRWSRRRRRVLL